MATPTNKAAWMEAAKQRPYVIKDAPYPTPGPHDIIVANKVVAINPIDAFVQAYDAMHGKYPNVAGCDVAGTVAQVGSEVKSLKVGQRVAGMACSLLTQDPADGGYQLFSRVNEDLVFQIPDAMSYEDASVLPVSLATGIDGLFGAKTNRLPRPSPGAPSPEASGKVVLVWGGASSTGSGTVQMARAAGYEVFTTASPGNFDYCRELGASQMFDYNSATIVDDVVAALKGKQVAGAVECSGTESGMRTAVEILSRTDGNKTLATVQVPPNGLAAGVRVTMLLSEAIATGQDLGRVMFAKYLTAEIARGTFKPMPKPEVIGNGLEAIQDGIDRVLKGVSRTKLVVTLD